MTKTLSQPGILPFLPFCSLIDPTSVYGHRIELAGKQFYRGFVHSPITNHSFVDNNMIRLMPHTYEPQPIPSAALEDSGTIDTQFAPSNTAPSTPFSNASFETQDIGPYRVKQEPNSQPGNVMLLKSLLKKQRPTTSAVRKKTKRTTAFSGTGKTEKYRLYCNHCDAFFFSKATYRHKFRHHLVNHKCQNAKRRQFVVGVVHRKCEANCNAQFGCIQFADDP